MKKNYFYTVILFFIFSLAAKAQDGKELGFYPNPASNGKIYITSKTTLDKEIVIFDVLGKKVFQQETSSKEINISTLSPGVYIIRIKEDDTTVTRKLIIK
jgi:hypothetical protein